MRKAYEDYIERLHIAMGKAPLAKKLELTEHFQNKLKELQSKNPSLSEAACIQLMEEPEEMALRFIKEQHLEDVVNKKSFVLRLFLILTSFFFLIILFITLLGVYFYKTESLIAFDDEKQTLDFFGKSFQVQSLMGQWQITQIDSENPLQKINGGISLDLQRIKRFSIHFKNAEFKFKTHKMHSLIWSCELPLESPSPAWTQSLSEEKGPDLYLDLSEFEAIRCQWTLPETLSLKLMGQNATVKISDHLGDLDLNMTNGLVKYHPHKKGQYQYDLNVVNGQIDTFISSQKAPATQVKIHLINGMIKK